MTCSAVGVCHCSVTLVHSLLTGVAAVLLSCGGCCSKGWGLAGDRLSDLGRDVAPATAHPGSAWWKGLTKGTLISQHKQRGCYCCRSLIKLSASCNKHTKPMWTKFRSHFSLLWFVWLLTLDICAFMIYYFFPKTIISVLPVVFTALCCFNYFHHPVCIQKEARSNFWKCSVVCSDIA